MNITKVVCYSIAPLVIWAMAGVTAPIWMSHSGVGGPAVLATAEAATVPVMPVADTPQPPPQTKCPIKGGAINKKLFADVDGYRIYVCCPGCLDKVRADPKAAVAKIRANGEEPEKAPVEKPKS